MTRGGGGGRGLGGQWLEVVWEGGRGAGRGGAAVVQARARCALAATAALGAGILQPCVAVAAAIASCRRPPAFGESLLLLDPCGRYGKRSIALGSVPIAAPRRWPPRLTKRLAGRRTTWCATTARPSSGEELYIALQALLPELARGLVH